MIDIQYCKYCAVEMTKPFNMSVDKWQNGGRRCCSRKCQNLMKRIDAQGYTARFLYANEISIIDFQKRLEGWLPQLKRSDVILKNVFLNINRGVPWKGCRNMDSKDYALRMACAISDMVPKMDFWGDDFVYDYRMALKGERCKFWFDEDLDVSANNIMRAIEHCGFESKNSFMEEMNKISSVAHNKGTAGPNTLEAKVKRLVIWCRKDWHRVGSEKIPVLWRESNWKNMLSKAISYNDFCTAGIAHCLMEVFTFYGLDIDYRRLLKQVTPERMLYLKEDMRVR